MMVRVDREKRKKMDWKKVGIRLLQIIKYRHHPKQY